MEWLGNILTLVSGLSLFLFGMQLMGEGLEKRAGKKLKSLLGRLTSNRFYGLLLGLGVTALIQSSSAVTVMTVGFVNSGLMTLRQSVGIIMGANIGTTVTAWLISLTRMEGGGLILQLFKPATFTPVLSVIGVICYLFSKRDSRRYTGLILLGFSVLMFGMDTMSDAMDPLADMPAFQRIFLLFSNPLLGILTGAVLTAILQSSSASVGILQALSVTGSLTVGGAVPIVMGQNIGTCVTSLISSVGAEKNAKRTAMVHLYFNLLGTLILMIPYFWISAGTDWIFLQNAASAADIALIHTLFNVLSTVILFPMAGLLERLAILTVRHGNAESHEEGAFLDQRLLASPTLAVERSRSVTEKMAEMAFENTSVALSLFSSFEVKKFHTVEEKEARVDRFEDEIGGYLLAVGSKNLGTEDSREVSEMLHLIGDFERISDHAVNLAQKAKSLSEGESSLPEEGFSEIKVLFGAVEEIMRLSGQALREKNLELASRVEPLEEVIDSLRMQIHANHVERLQQGNCDLASGLILADLLTDLERIADHCSNIAGHLLTMANHQPIHAYLQYVRTSGQEAFTKWYEYYRKEYAI
ncbi:MAG: Na/Pi cotransporter family protein [Clostridia bacterium]|nr:Na/Pi cotransporter family protein [Clostridia bacterium]